LNRSSSPRSLVLLIGFCLLLQPLATDFYLASLPGLVRRFATTPAVVQLTLSVFAIGFGAMQLIAGPVSDRFGRRPTLLAGIALYTCGCLTCALAMDMDMLIAGRFVQAIGCSTAVVVVRAVVRDAFAPEAGARALAVASSVLGIGAVIGPIAGSLLEVQFGFRASFLVVGSLATALLVMVAIRLNETNRHPDATATDLPTLFANLRRVGGSREFLAFACAGAASYAGLFAFISGSSFVLIQVLGVPTAWFGACFTFVVSGYLLGTVLCRHLLARYRIVRTMTLGAWLSAAGGLLLVGFALAGIHEVVAVLLPQFLYFAAHGIVFPCAMSGTVGPFPRLAGTAAGLFGLMTMAVASCVGAWIGASHNGTVMPLALTIGAASLVVLITVSFWVRRFPDRALPA